MLQTATFFFVVVAFFVQFVFNWMERRWKEWEWEVQATAQRHTDQCASCSFAVCVCVCRFHVLDEKISMSRKVESFERLKKLPCNAIDAIWSCVFSEASASSLFICRCVDLFDSIVLWPICCNFVYFCLFVHKTRPFVWFRIEFLFRSQCKR